MRGKDEGEGEGDVECVGEGGGGGGHRVSYNIAFRRARVKSEAERWG